MDSKNRIAKEILPIMLKERKEYQFWVEPFVGGGNIIDKVTGNRIGSDADEDVINALVGIRDCLIGLPRNNKEFTEDHYKSHKMAHKYYPTIYSSYCAYALSYGGKKWGGWSRDGKGKRDYVAESYRNAVKQSPNLKGVDLVHSPYNKLNIPDNSIIYCDPPYENTTKYNSSFNHSEFWQWCRDMKSQGHIVFVSEYNAPSDFICVWEKEMTSSLTKDTGSKKAVERLFKL